MLGLILGISFALGLLISAQIGAKEIDTWRLYWWIFCCGIIVLFSLIEIVGRS